MSDATNTEAPSPAKAETRPRKKLLKPMLAMLGLTIVLLGAIAGTKYVQISKAIAQSKQVPPPAVVTALPVTSGEWQPQISAVGSAKAVRGVDVTTEVGGIVRAVMFKPGQDVAAGALLVQLNADSDVASLHALEATAALAETVLKRDRAQLELTAVAQAVVDADEADLKAKRAQVEQQAAAVAKKAIRAPFAGRIGLTSVNPGQYLNPGDKIASLQTVDPIYVDFSVPQERLDALSLGQLVTVTTDALRGKSFSGKITAIDSKVDVTTRNVTIEATVSNAKKELLPGMFMRAEVATGSLERHLTVPQTAVTYNPYGVTVFVAAPQKDASGHEVLSAQQRFVKTGPTRGDQVAILSGLKEGEQIITSGQLKLKNGSAVRVDNRVAPSNSAAPTPQEQ
jgi:membrane fusion protein (multidrug efflux system)